MRYASLSGSLSLWGDRMNSLCVYGAGLIQGLHLTQVLGKQPHHLKREGRHGQGQQTSDRHNGSLIPRFRGSNVNTSSAALTFLLDPAIERGGHDEPLATTLPSTLRSPCRKSHCHMVLINFLFPHTTGGWPASAVTNTCDVT